MKKYTLIFLFSITSLIAAAQPDAWQQKNDLGWNAQNGPTDRRSAAGFSINNKMYLGTGFDGANKKDFWEYDPMTDAWTQKADFGGSTRQFATGFAIGDKGYVGLGYTGTGIAGWYAEPNLYNKDFWEYNPATNTWTKKADFGGSARFGAAGFGIADKGYIGTGCYGAGYAKDLWQYDPLTDSWTQKSDFGGSGRCNAVSFVINNSKAYIGTGNDGQAPFQGYKNDFWEYDPQSDSWTRKADVGGSGRTQAIGFSIADKGYLGLGSDDIITNNKNDLWEYNPATDIWTKKANFTGDPRHAAIGISLGNAGYIGLGTYGSVWSNYWQFENDLWKYDPITDSWTRRADFGGSARTGAVGFCIGSKGYVGLGFDLTANDKNDFWEFDPQNNTWTQKANFGGVGRMQSIGFNIGTKGYVGLGVKSTGGYFSDFWEYDPIANAWTQKANFLGVGRAEATSFSIGNKGYVGMGYDGGNIIGTGDNGFKNDFWEYDPLADNWVQKANFGGVARKAAVGFSIGSKGYAGTGYAFGYSAVNTNDFWEYDPLMDKWIQKASFAGAPRVSASGFSFNNEGYIGAGYFTTYMSDFWKYNPLTDNWTQVADFTGGGRYEMVSFNIGNKGYLGTGLSFFPSQFGGTVRSDFWQYSSREDVRTSVGDYITSSSCPALSGNSFIWESDNNNNLVLGLNPNSNNMGATCWGVRNLAAGTYRNSLGWFGGTQTQYGAYMTRNYVVTPGIQPSSPVTIRLYCTAEELNDFINYFNSTYGSSYTASDIRIIRYDGTNQDLDLNNNSTASSDYTSIVPTLIGNYGLTDEYRYFEFNTAGFSEFYIALSSPNGPLAVNLLNFTAQNKNGISILRWQTTKEQDASYFNIQRSKDGRIFSGIGKIVAAGNSNSLHNYYFEDTDAGRLGVNTIFYRLEEVDKNGKSVYSNIVRVEFIDLKNSLVVSPNPATNNLTLHINCQTTDKKGTFIISDITGKKIMAAAITLNTGQNYIPVSIERLVPGLYNILIVTGELKMRTNFIKQ